MENPIIDQYRRMFNVELPNGESMDDFLDFILANIRPMSEDLVEVEYWMNKRWMEIRDDLDFHEDVLHIFGEGGEYLVSIDGNISKGAWRTLENTNTLIIEHGARNELYDLAFLNSDYFILKKHGNQRRKGQPKYFIVGNEYKVKDLEWRDAMEDLFNIYRNNSRWTTFLGVVIFLLAIILILSLV